MPDPMNLTINDVLGIIQRQLSELNAYLSQAPANVDRDIVMAYLERSASFAQRLPGRREKTEDAAEARAN